MIRKIKLTAEIVTGRLLGQDCGNLGTVSTTTFFETRNRVAQTGEVRPR